MKPTVEELISKLAENELEIVQKTTEEQSFALMANPIIYNPASMLNPVPGSAILQRQRELAFTFLTLLENFGDSKQMQPTWQQLCKEMEEQIIIYDAKKKLPTIPQLHELNHGEFSRRFEEFLGKRAKFIEDYGETVLKQIGTDQQNFCGKDERLQIRDRHAKYLQELLTNLKNLNPEGTLKTQNNLNCLPYDSSHVCKYSLQGDLIVENNQLYQLEEYRKIDQFPFLMAICAANYGEILNIRLFNGSGIVLQQQSFGLVLIHQIEVIQQPLLQLTSYENYIKQYKLLDIPINVNHCIIQPPSDGIEPPQFDFWESPFQFKFQMPKNKLFNCNPQQNVEQFFDVQTKSNRVFMLTRKQLIIKLFVDSEFVETTVIDLPETKHPLTKITVTCENQVVCYNYLQLFLINTLDNQSHEITPNLNTITNIYYLNELIFVAGKLVDQYKVTNSVVIVFNQQQRHSNYLIGARGMDIRQIIYQQFNEVYLVSVEDSTSFCYFRLQKDENIYQVVQFLPSQIIGADKFYQSSNYFSCMQYHSGASLIFTNGNLTTPLAINYNLHSANTQDVCILEPYCFIATDKSLEVLKIQGRKLEKLRVFGIYGGVNNLLVIGSNRILVLGSQGGLYILQLGLNH